MNEECSFPTGRYYGKIYEAHGMLKVESYLRLQLIKSEEKFFPDKVKIDWRLGERIQRGGRE